ncbi:MAG: VOC family protein [Verrucomicrobiota bacterium]
MGANKHAILQDQAAVLLVTDVVEAAGFWHDKLGFSEGSFWGDPPDFCICQRDGQSVFLAQATGQAALVPLRQLNPHLWNFYLFVDNVEAMYREVKKRGAPLEYGLCDQPYGCREFAVRDPDGNVVGIGQNRDGAL